jgi:hypothetical protein
MSFPFLTDARSRHQLLVTSALALALVAMPVGMSTYGPFLDGKAALAKNDNGNNGNGGGHGNAGGNGHGNAGGNGRGVGQGLDGEDDLFQRGRGQGAGAGGPHDLDEFLDGVRSGKAFGLEHRDARIAAAQERYQEALGKHGHASPDDEIVAYDFSSEETATLIEHGWRGRTAGEDGFRNHGERTRTMVELSKQLGYGARVGAMQANFGTPHENDAAIADLQAQLAAATDPVEIERLEAELAAATDRKPGNGPDDAWATVDLDVNGDHVVDRRDLEALANPGDGEEEQVAEDDPPAEEDQVAGEEPPADEQLPAEEEQLADATP